MENASKALIIAGAIILSVLIIILGMYFYNQAAGVGKSVNMTEYEIQQFNSKFTMYEGEISGAQAKQLCDVIENHNAAYSNEQTKQVAVAEISQDAKATDTSKIGQGRARKSYIQDGLRYKVTIGYDTSTGLVSNIGIQAIN